jgi:hypothetical protein
MKRMTIIFLVLVMLMGTSLILDASQDEAQTKVRKEVIKVNYIDARTAYSILMPYLSRNGKIQLVRENNMLIVEDIPEMVDKVLSILKEIDIKPLGLQFTVDLIVGSMSGSPLPDSHTADDASGRARSNKPDKKLQSDPLIKELSKILAYESYAKLDSTLINVQDNTRSTQRLGGEGLTFRLDLLPRYIKEKDAESIRVELSLSRDSAKRDGSLLSLTLIETTLSLKSGDRSVVGVSKLNGGDKALILILSGKVIH